jgi:ABC-type protease/lipase transport system fused ATPase/permease subunit
VDTDSGLKALELVGLVEEGCDLSTDRGSLSGGQAQRLYLARAIYHQPKLIFIDEGTSALDLKLEATMAKIFRDLADRGSSMILIAHRPQLLGIGDRTLAISNPV